MLPEFLEYRPKRAARPAFPHPPDRPRLSRRRAPPPPDELEEALRRLGIKRGTTVEVGDEELEWQ